MPTTPGVPSAPGTTGTPGATGVLPPVFGQGGAATPTSGPNGSSTLANQPDISGTGLSSAEAYLTVTYHGQTQTMAQWVAQLSSMSQGEAMSLQQQLYNAGLLPTIPTGAMTGAEGKATVTAFISLLRDAHNNNTDAQMVLTQDTQDTIAAGGPTAKSAAALKTVGIGKFPIKYTNPVDVAAATNNAAQQLTGMDATPEQIQAITTGLHAMEQASAQIDYQQYVDQQMQYFTFFGGGRAQTPGANGAAAATTAAPPVAAAVVGGPAVAAVPVPGAPISNAPGGGLTGGPTTGGPVTGAEGGTLPAGATTLSDGTVSIPPSTAASSANPLPPGAVTLANGTVLVPPGQISSVAPASASAAAAQALRGTANYTAFNWLNAYDALNQLVKTGGK